MKTSTLFATALMSMGLVISLQAQGPPPGGPGMRPGGRMGGGMRFDPARMEKREWDLLDKVNLKPTQKARLKPMVSSYVKHMGEARAKMKPGDFQSMRATMMPIRQEFEGKLAKVLSKGQMDKYNAARKEEMAKMMARFRGGPGGRPGGPGGRP